MGFIFGIGILAIVAGLIAYGIIAKRKRLEAMAALAQQRGWKALSNDPAALSQYLPQYLRGLGDNSGFEMAYQATVEGVQLVFFQYHYTIYVESFDAQSNTMQRHSENHYFSVVQTMLPRSTANILLLHHSMLSKLTNLIQHWGMQQVSLEGDFNQYFDTYITPGSQVEALSVLSPEVMAALIDTTRNASLQFNGQSMVMSIETSDLSAATVEPLLHSVVAVVKKVADRPVLQTAPTPQVTQVV